MSIFETPEEKERENYFPLKTLSWRACCCLCSSSVVYPASVWLRRNETKCSARDVSNRLIEPAEREKRLGRPGCEHGCLFKDSLSSSVRGFAPFYQLISVHSDSDTSNTRSESNLTDSAAHKFTNASCGVWESVPIREHVPKGTDRDVTQINVPISCPTSFYSAGTWVHGGWVLLRRSGWMGVFYVAFGVSDEPSPVSRSGWVRA